MKKISLVLLGFVPIIVGYLLNIMIMVPVIGMSGFYLLPLLTTVFWFCLGKRCAHSTWKTVSAVFAAHIAGICSLLIYIWQFEIMTDETRNIALAAFSQMFSASAPMYLFGVLIRPFENAMLAMQIISLLYMMFVFTVAIVLEKRKKYK